MEGYSDFLQVLLATSILEIVRLLQLDEVHVFTINTAWSLACGVGVVWLTFRMLRRLPGVGAPGIVAGMMFVVLAGPLAVWSCSSLETGRIPVLRALAATVGGARPELGYGDRNEVANRRWLDSGRQLHRLVRRCCVRGFERYVKLVKNESWLAHPTLDPHRYLAS